ncbi:MAG: hypothetical protein M1546_26340, partial [Chloroflexi bacterium]|nr:hypothetical protein [Chloroflexota bacterium]
MQDRPRPASPLLWVLTIISLLLNLAIIAVLVVVIVVGRQMAGDVADQLEAFGNQTINYKFRVNQTVPIHTMVPFDHTVVVPFQQAVPI